MQWIFNYQLFLFDFDGLLADTEQIHHQAYLAMCAQRGFPLNWSFHRYSEVAYHGPTDLRDQIYAELPALYEQEPNWSILYEEKKRTFLTLIESEPVSLMDGAAELLLSLQEAKINSCVVTHSPSNLIKCIKRQNPILDLIPHWITREDYHHPKPHPECYQAAIQRLAKPQDKIIGFEDSPRGLNALVKTKAKPILVCPSHVPYLKATLNEFTSLSHFPSLRSINDTNAP